MFILFNGRFHKPIYALGQPFTLWAKLLRLQRASQKLGVERKRVYEIDPRGEDDCCFCLTSLYITEAEDLLQRKRSHAVFIAMGAKNSCH